MTSCVATPTDALRFTVTLRADCSFASGLRRLVTAHIRYWGLSELVDRATLVAHELYTNAIVHGSESADSLITVEVERRDAEVYIAVTDTSCKTPVVTSADEDDERGRGLAIVECLASSWDAKVDRGRKVVWATLSACEEAASSP
jgi:anti-sigma regulatory factor (Ser/Thr protein kinase)